DYDRGLELIPLSSLDERLTVGQRLRLDVTAGFLENPAAHELDGRSKQLRPDTYSDQAPEKDGCRHRLPVHEFRSRRSPRLAVQVDQHQAHRHLPRRLEHGEERGTPWPLADWKPSQMERRHSEEKERSQYEPGG